MGVDISAPVQAPECTAFVDADDATWLSAARLHREADGDDLGIVITIDADDCGAADSIMLTNGTALPKMLREVLISDPDEVPMSRLPLDGTPARAVIVGRSDHLRRMLGLRKPSADLCPRLDSNQRPPA